jgi:hypothetical protein
MKKVRVHVNFPVELKEKAIQRAKELGLSLSAFCVLAVAEHLKQVDALDVLSELRSIMTGNKEDTEVEKR